MSHVASVECLIQDLDALKAAADKLGFEFRENQKTHKWYGRFLNDWSNRSRAAVHKGHDPKTFGHCEHALRLKAQPDGYEVGVVTRKDGEGYDLIYDSFGSGRSLEQAAGVDMGKLVNEYQAEVACRYLDNHGYRVEREEEANQIRLIARR